MFIFLLVSLAWGVFYALQLKTQGTLYIQKVLYVLVNGFSWLAFETMYVLMVSFFWTFWEADFEFDDVTF